MIFQLLVISLGFVFLMCVFPFILNISLLFFKRLKLRIFFRVSIARFFFLLLLFATSFPSSDTRLFFVIFIVFFWNQSVTLFFAGCYNFNFCFSIRIITQNTRARSHQFTLFCWVCVCLCVCVYVSESVKQWLKSLRMCVCICLLGLSFPLEVKKRLHRILLNPTSFTTFCFAMVEFTMFFRGKTAHF